MASIQPRYSSTDPNKITSYKVTWRDANGHQRGQTATSKRAAEKIKKRAEEHGKDPERQRIVRTGDSGLRVSFRNGEPVVQGGPKPADRYGNLYITGYVDAFLAQHPYAEGSPRVVAINLRKHVIPAFSNRAMKDIKAADVDLFYPPD